MEGRGNKQTNLERLTSSQRSKSASLAFLPAEAISLKTCKWWSDGNDDDEEEPITSDPMELIRQGTLRLLQRKTHTSQTCFSSTINRVNSLYSGHPLGPEKVA